VSGKRCNRHLDTNVYRFGGIEAGVAKYEWNKLVPGFVPVAVLLQETAKLIKTKRRG